MWSRNHIPPTLHFVFSLTLTVNSCINPLTLYFLSKVFRRHFNRYLFRKCKSHSGNNNDWPLMRLRRNSQSQTQMSMPDGLDIPLRHSSIYSTKISSPGYSTNYVWKERKKSLLFISLCSCRSFLDFIWSRRICFVPITSCTRHSYSNFFAVNLARAWPYFLLCDCEPSYGMSVVIHVNNFNHLVYNYKVNNAICPALLNLSHSVIWDQKNWQCFGFGFRDERQKVMKYKFEKCQRKHFSFAKNVWLKWSTGIFLRKIG